MTQRTEDYAGSSTAATLNLLQTDAQRGLTQAEAARRLQQYGRNEIEERVEPLWHRIFRRFWGPIPWMIEVAAILSAVAGLVVVNDLLKMWAYRRLHPRDVPA